MARKTADTGIPEKIDWDETKAFEGYFHSVQHGLPSAYGDFDAATLVDMEGNRKSTVLTVDLARGLEQAPLGSHVWITYKGKERLPNGNAVKRFDVDYDDEDRIPVPEPRAAAPSPSTAAAPGGTAYDEEPF